MNDRFPPGSAAVMFLPFSNGGTLFYKNERVCIVGPTPGSYWGALNIESLDGKRRASVHPASLEELGPLDQLAAQAE